MASNDIPDLYESIVANGIAQNKALEEKKRIAKIALDAANERALLEQERYDAVLKELEAAEGLGLQKQSLELFQQDGGKKTKKPATKKSATKKPAAKKPAAKKPAAKKPAAKKPAAKKPAAKKPAAKKPAAKKPTAKK